MNSNHLFSIGEYFTQYSKSSPADVSYCVAVPPDSTGTFIKKSSPTQSNFFHHGAYEEISQARNKLLFYAEEHNIKLSGVFRNLYLEGPPQHKDKNKFITQIIAIIE